MIDVASVYAELGFKVDKSGIKEFKKSLREAKAGIDALSQVEKLRTVQEKRESSARINTIKEQSAHSTADLQNKKELLRIEKLEQSIVAAKNKDQITLDKEADRKADRVKKEKKEQEKKEERERKAREKAEKQRAAALKSSVLWMSRLVGLSSLFTLATSVAFGKMAQMTGKKGLGLTQFGFVSGGADIKKLQGYQAAAYKYAPNLTSEDVMSQVLGLQQQAIQAYLGGNQKAFQILGVNALERDPFKILEQLRSAAKTAMVKKENAPILTNLLGQMGMSPEWLNILTANEKDFSVLTTGMMSEDQIKRAAEMGQEFRELGFALSNLKDQFVLAFGEETQGLLRDVIKLVKDLTGGVPTIVKESLQNIKDMLMPFYWMFHLAPREIGAAFAPKYEKGDDALKDEFLSATFGHKSAQSRVEYFKNNPDAFQKLLNGSVERDLNTTNDNRTTNQTINVSYAPQTSFTNPTEQQVREVSHNIGSPDIEQIAEAFKMNAVYQALPTT